MKNETTVTARWQTLPAMTRREFNAFRPQSEPKQGRRQSNALHLGIEGIKEDSCFWIWAYAPAIP